MDMPNCQAAMTFTEATVNKFIMDEEKTTCGTPLRVFWVNSSTLGYDSLTGEVGCDRALDDSGIKPTDFSDAGCHANSWKLGQ